MEQQPQPVEGEQQPVNSYGTDDPSAQARIEAARSAAAEERRRDRARLEHYVEAGLDPDDAETLIDFQHLAHRQATHPQEPEYREAGHGYRPRIYVADQTNHDQGLVHGYWLDAARGRDELDADITATRIRAWTVQASKDFAGLDVHGFTDTVLISRLARGVAEHGAAYAAYVAIVGTNDTEILDKFTDLYVGSYDNTEAWARAVADDLDWHQQLDREITDPMLRRYVVIDYAKLAREGAQGWDVVTGHDGRTHVFLR
jgi:antirestriction protein